MSNDTPIINPVIKTISDNILGNMDAAHTEPSVTTPDLVEFYTALERVCADQRRRLTRELVAGR